MSLQQEKGFLRISEGAGFVDRKASLAGDTDIGEQNTSTQAFTEKVGRSFVADLEVRRNIPVPCDLVVQ